MEVDLIYKVDGRNKQANRRGLRTVVEETRALQRNNGRIMIEDNYVFCGYISILLPLYKFQLVSKGVE